MDSNFEDEIERIGVSEKTSEYGEAKRSSANELYKRYLVWFKNKYAEKEPLSFKDWIEWGKSRGLLEQKNSNDIEDNRDAVKPDDRNDRNDRNDIEEIKPEIEIEDKKLIKNSITRGNILASILLLISAVFIITNLIKNKK